MPHLHLSLQSGDDMILKRMKRRHRATMRSPFCAQPCAVAARHRLRRRHHRRLPDRNRRDVRELARHRRGGGLTFLHVFPYSPAPRHAGGAHAAGGKKEAVEQPAENEVLPPLNFDALEALKPAEEVPAAAETPVAGETPAVPIEEPTPEPAPETPPTPPVVPEPKPAEQPVPIEPGPQPVPQEEPAVEPEKPAEQPVPAPSPVEPEPTPAEVPLPPVEPSTPELPAEVPAQPVPSAPEPTMRAPETEPVVEEPVVEAPASVPPEPVAEPRPVEPVDEEPAPIAAEAPVPVAMAAEEAQPVAALRKPAPVVVPAPAEPVQASSAPEPKPSAGKVTVQKKVEQKAEIVEVAAPAPRQSWFQRLRQGLSRSSKELSGNIAGIFTKRKLDEDTLQDLEDVLIRADLGVETALRVTDALAASRYGKDVSDHEVRSIMAVEVEKVLKPVALPLELDLSHKPQVILVVGVNGVGKTTTIGKIASKLHDDGKKVMLAAGDTFRAAAIEQLKIWGERAKAPVLARETGADAAGLAFDALTQAQADGIDVLMIDTAGRLQNKADLMAGAGQDRARPQASRMPDAPHHVLQTAGCHHRPERASIRSRSSAMSQV
jgi:fused signal recognition particle receptor